MLDGAGDAFFSPATAHFGGAAALENGNGPR